MGTFYVVATPIGNLGDISHRALEVVSSVSVVLAEDTRHSRRLFNHYGISTKLRACHQHNEAELVDWVIRQLGEGHDLALVSDAGTPLISDPGFVMVRALREQGINICAVPGPSSIIAALSIAGLATNQFVFDGFLPAKSSARKTQLQTYLSQSRTIVLLESSHRIEACLADIVEVLGGDRKLVLARELTKKFETVLSGTAADVWQTLRDDPDQSRGEFVLMLEGAAPVPEGEMELRKLLQVLLQEFPLKQAASLAARITGGRKNEIYDLALILKSGRDNDS